MTGVGESGDRGVMQTFATDQPCGLGQVTPPHWVSGDKRKSYFRGLVHALKGSPNGGCE